MLQCDRMNDIADTRIFDIYDELLPSTEYTTKYDDYFQWDPCEDDSDVFSMYVELFMDKVRWTNLNIFLATQHHKLH